MTTAPYDMRAVLTSEDELRAVTELFRRVWPDSHDAKLDYVRWLYRDSPEGEVIGVNAWAGPTLAGHYAVVPITAALHGRVVRAALSLNTVVHPAHRGRGLLTTLGEATYDEARRRSVDHVVGVANENSTHGMVKSLRFDLVGPLETRLVWALPPLHATAEPVWRRVWSPQTLTWRLSNPVTAYARRRRGAAVAVMSPTRVRRLQTILQYTDHPEAVTTAERVLSRSATWRPRLWVGLTRRFRFAARHGVVLPARLRTKPLNLIYRPLGDVRATLGLGDVEFEGIDFDIA